VAVPNNPGKWQTPAHHWPDYPLGSGGVPTLAAGIATLTIGPHTIPAQTMAEVSEINPTGYDLGEVFVLGANGAAGWLTYSATYPPTSASPNPGPGTYRGGGIVETPERGPVLPAAPGNAQSWLFYSSTGGFYWGATKTPRAADDAFLGWVLTSANAVIAFSTRKIGTGPEPFIVPYPVPQLAVAPDGDTGVAGAPSFGVGVATMGQLQISGLGFADTSNTASITSGTAQIWYVDETAGVDFTVSDPMDAAVKTLTASGPLPTSVPYYLLIDGEVVQVTAAAGAVGTVVRGQLSSAAAGHDTGAVCRTVVSKTVVFPLPLGFIGTEAAGQWALDVPLRCGLVVAVSMLVTNGAGNSPATLNNYSSGFTDNGLRVLSGGQITFSVPGLLAVQAGAAPAAVLPASTSVRDIFATLNQSGVGWPTGAAVVAKVRISGQVVATLTIPLGQAVSNVILGNYLYIAAGQVVTCDVTQVGSTYPGAGLTVMVRL